MTKPRVTATGHELPFERLSPRDFERLCLWLVRREGYPTAEHVGAAGSDRGRDLVAQRDDGVAVFQCKREKQFGPSKAEEAVRKILVDGPPPAEIILLVACDATKATRERALAVAAGVPCTVWARSELDERVKRHPETIEEFFEPTRRENRPNQQQEASDRTITPPLLLERPKVFISYSHHSPEHRSQVLALADRLRRDGVDANLDQYEAWPSLGWRWWMKRAIKEADSVVVICTEPYRRRLEGSGRDRGRRSQWDGPIVTQEDLDSSSREKRFVPIIVTDSDEASVPTFLGRPPIPNVSTESGYESLYRILTSQPAAEKPILGKLKALPQRKVLQVFEVGPSRNDDFGHRLLVGSLQTLQRMLAPGLLGLIVGGICYWSLNLSLVPSALIALLVAFFLKVWVILEQKWATSLAGWIDAELRLVFSGFRRRYFRHLVYRHRVFNVRGLRTQGAFTLELENVFVNLKVAHRSVQQLNPDLLHAENLRGKREIWDLLTSDHMAFRSLAVIGAPGSGKTTLLQHLSLIFAQNLQRRYNQKCRAYVPILLFLRSHVNSITLGDTQTLADLVRNEERKEGLSPPASWFERVLRSGKALVLLDGLDEVADSKKRKAVVDWVANQIQVYGRSRFIVTSRPHGYRTNPLPAATMLEVLPFELVQVKHFVNSWYLANEILSFNKDDPGVRYQAAKQAEDLLQRLRNAPTLAALAINPLLLTMIAMVHRYRGVLPERRVELYGEICDVLLGHWQIAKGLTATLTPAQKRVTLQPLALHLMSARAREISGEDAKEIIRSSLVGIEGASADPGLFLKDIEEGSGLLVEREVGFYSFAHLTFQEYLAATHLLQSRPEKLFSMVTDSWWHETIRLYAAQSDATSIIRVCLEDSSIEALTLAFEILGEAMTVDATAREQLERVLIGGLESGDSARRRLASEIALNLRLRRLLRLNEVMDISDSYVSCAEYQLFIDDMLAEGIYRQPDHWPGTSFTNGSARLPVSGVRASDASEFCKWLTRRMKERGHANYIFRLPTAEEAASAAISPRGDRFDSLRVDTVGTWTGGIPKVVGAGPTARAAQQDLLVELIRVLPDRRVANIGEFDYLSEVAELATSKAFDLDLERAADLAGSPGRGAHRELVFTLNLIARRAHALDEEATLTSFRNRLLGEMFDYKRRSGSLYIERSRGTERARALSLVQDDLKSWYSGEKAEILLILVALEERIKGNLPAWEGIRIVRERIPEESEGGEPK